MALPFLAQAGIAMAPSVVGGLARMFNKSKPSAYEREMRGLAQFYKDEMGKDYADTASGAGKIGLLNDQADQYREGIDKTSAISGGTDESRISKRGNANQAKAAGLRSIFAGADFDRRNNELNQLNAMQMAESERQRREQNREDSIGRLTGGLSQVAGMYLANQAQNTGEIDPSMEVQQPTGAMTAPSPEQVVQEVQAGGGLPTTPTTTNLPQSVANPKAVSGQDMVIQRKTIAPMVIQRKTIAPIETNIRDASPKSLAGILNPNQKGVRLDASRNAWNPNIELNKGYKLPFMAGVR